MKTEYCTQCQEPILPGAPFLGKFFVGEHAPMHEGCYCIREEAFGQEVFWFDYGSSGVAGEDTVRPR